MWTGDNLASYEHMRMSVPMLLSSSIAGMPFCGADVGGFFKNPSNALLARWYQLGALQPFFRAHAHIETARREPYLLDEEHLAIVRAALYTRYRLLPYIYSLFYQSTVDGSPLVRPTWYEYPRNRAVIREEE